MPDCSAVTQRETSAGARLYAGDEVIDTEIHQLALAALQKLSLRRAAQEALVAAGIIPWIVTYLRMHETLSEHAVEYSMAMLMNCCLCRSGRKACEQLEVLGILDGMVQARARQCMASAAGAVSVGGLFLHSAPDGTGCRN